MKIQFHIPPEGYSYEFDKDFKRNTVAIWIRNHSHFDYNGADSIKSIWGFYNTKTRQFHSPVNAQTVGSVVDINKTTPYSAMQLLKSL
jgi:hypothetical protein